MPTRRHRRSAAGAAAALAPLALLAPALLALVSGCARPDPGIERYRQLVAYEAGVDSIGPQEFALLSPVEQQRRHELARAALAEAFRVDRKDIDPRKMVSWSELNDQATRRQTRWRTRKENEPWQLPHLARAVGLDPTSALAWYELGVLAQRFGDLERGARCLDQVVDLLRDARDEQSRRMWRQAVVARAWIHHDRGRPEPGLALLDRLEAAGPAAPGQGRRDARGDAELRREAVVLRALLLAQAGRRDEAMAIADRLEPVRLVKPGHVGPSTERSGYQRAWIHAMVLLREGDPESAHKAAQPFYPYDGYAPLLDRYWSDMALICELADRREETITAIVRSIAPLPVWRYACPLEGAAGEARIYGQPRCDVPFVVSWRHHYVIGSLYSYAMQAASMAASGTGGADLAGAALAALDACIRRGIRPLSARIGRGCLLAAVGRLDEAEAELAAVDAVLRAQGRRDFHVSLMRGNLALLRSEPRQARTRLLEAIAADSTGAEAWSALGIAEINLGRADAGRAALDRAVLLDPGLMAAWFNRGLLSLQEGRCADALADLRGASGLAPRHRRVVRMLAEAEAGCGAAASGEGAAGDEAARTVELAPDELVMLFSIGHEPDDPGLGIFPFNPEALVEQVPPEMLPGLRADYDREPRPGLRLLLARSYLAAGRAEETAGLLAPLWPADLTPRERRLLLEADRALGDPARALGIVAGLAGLAEGATPAAADAGGAAVADPVASDPDLLLMAALVCLDHGRRPEGRRAVEAALALAPDRQELRGLQRMLDAEEVPDETGTEGSP